MDVARREPAPVAAFTVLTATLAIAAARSPTWASFFRSTASGKRDDDTSTCSGSGGNPDGLHLVPCRHSASSPRLARLSGQAEVGLSLPWSPDDGDLRAVLRVCFETTFPPGRSRETSNGFCGVMR